MKNGKVRVGNQVARSQKLSALNQWPKLAKFDLSDVFHVHPWLNISPPMPTIPGLDNHRFTLSGRASSPYVLLAVEHKFFNRRQATRVQCKEGTINLRKSFVPFGAFVRVPWWACRFGIANS